MSRVDLIIPTYNGDAILRRCLESLRDSTFRDFQLIVSDDGSSAPIRQFVLRHFPDAAVVRSARNHGLAYAVNRAIDAGGSELVVLLNNDTVVEPTWLEELVTCADRHPRAGSIASKLRLFDDRGTLHSAGDYYSVRGMPGNRGVWMDDLGQFDREEPVFGACGGAALYRRKALDSVRLPNGNVFDERLFMYCEDVDLAWRLQAAGLPCVFAPRAVVYHELSATGGGTLASYYVARNSWLVMARSVPLGVLAPYRKRIAAYHAGRLLQTLRHIREPAARAALRGSAAGLMLAAVSRTTQQRPVAADIVRLRSLLHEPDLPKCG